MDAIKLEELHNLNGQSDIEMLQALKKCCDKEDLAEVDLLLYLNDTVGIGWGAPSAPGYEKEFQVRESEYYERKMALLKKYDTEESWLRD